MRAVLDVNVLVSASLSPDGPPAALVRAWEEGAFELVTSPLLLSELERVFAYPKVRRIVTAEDVHQVLEALRRSGTMVPDPDAPPPVHASDPDDDYLIALAADQGAYLVSGDRDLLALADEIPVRGPAAFLELLQTD